MSACPDCGRPRCLDMFCGAGGLSVGYDRAGFCVTGVDHIPHPDYPYRLIVADVMDVLANGHPDIDLDDYDLIHGSPPCPRFSTVTPDHTRAGHPDHLTPFRQHMRQWGGTYVIENVPGAPMPTAITLCGPAMGLPKIRRHRLFESSAFLLSPGCACDGRQKFGVYGDHADQKQHFRPDGTARGTKATSVAHAQEVLGVDWMTEWDDLADCVPPAYSEFVGLQLLDQMEAAA